VDETLLSGWLDGLEALPVHDEASIVLAVAEGRRQARAAGLGDTAIDELAIVVSELAQNQRRHATNGHIAYRPFERSGKTSLEVIAADGGPGIASLTEAFGGAPKPRAGGPGLGIGLAAVRRMSDEIDVDVRIGEGSCLWVRKLAPGMPRHREVAVVGRRLEGERVTGDDASFVRFDGHLLLALADGLGHGPNARLAAQRAIRAARASAALELPELMLACDRAVEGTRGCVLCLERLEQQTGAIDHAGVGDVSGALFGAGSARRLVNEAGLLGARGRRRPPRMQRAQLQAGEVLVLFTDGIQSRVDLSGEAFMLRQRPYAIAEHVLERWARGHDDAMVVVVR
jgi:anti-sigma regulatory factor (Ser/Thr protein kinase)